MATLTLADWVSSSFSKYTRKPWLSTIAIAMRQPFFTYVVAHEVGHQWWYNLVGNDVFDDPWLDESLTQFVTMQYYADQYGKNGEDGYRSSLEGRWARVDNAKIPIGLPVADYQGAEYGAIVYGRGPLFIVALREKMWVSAFDTFMKEYTQTFSWGIATPEELQTLAEERCACSLQDLVDEWVYP